MEPAPGLTPPACKVTGGDCSPVGWGLDGLFDIPGMIVNAVTSFLGTIVEQIMKPVRELLADTLLATPDVTRHADLKRLWAGALEITAGIYVLFVVAGGITVMGYETVQTRYALKQIAPRLLTGVIASAMSLTVMGKAITLGNALSHAIMGLGMADAGQGLVERVLPFALFGTTGLKIYLLILAIVLLVLVLAVLIGFVVRVTVMALLAISGPLALACHAHPLTDPVARLWWRGLAGCLVIQVAQSMTFIVALKLFFAPGATALGIPYSDQLGTMLAGLALFWVLFKIPGWTMQVVFRATPIHNPHAPTAVRLLRTLALYRLMDRYLPGTSLLRRGPGRGGGPTGGGPTGRGGGPAPRPGPGLTPGSRPGRVRLGRGSAGPRSGTSGTGPGAGTGSPGQGGSSGPAGSWAARAGGPVTGSAAALTLPRGPAGRLSAGSRLASSDTSRQKGPLTVVHPAQARRRWQLTLPVAAQRVPIRTPRPVQTWLPIRAERIPRPHTADSGSASRPSTRPPVGPAVPRMASRQMVLRIPAERVRSRPVRPVQLRLPLEPPRR
ncbi:hypothetical protein ACH4TX_19215 [Streptomyces sp. NPDC021098]|uniref:hypothetical protein n=1 Tax=unclassified Streptomyces TaxID=2593676 RepID=UPI0037A13DDB